MAFRAVDEKDFITLDSETCGLHGMAVLLQYAEGDGPIILYNIWDEPVGKTLELIERICSKVVIGFNLAFDHFHLCKIYTIWNLLPRDWIPREHIDDIALLEPKGMDGPCLKPVAAMDLLLHSRKGPYQSLMAREDIRIKRVPTALAYALAQELEQRIHIDGIYFARRADKDAPRWKVYDIVSKRGIVNKDFKDVVLKFNAGGSLKILAEHALKIKPTYLYQDIELDNSWRPYELGYAPFALAVAGPPDWTVCESGKVVGMAWPALIHEHIRHWRENVPAREYASDDVKYTRLLYEHFDRPEPGDDDSELACMVAAVRWHGLVYNQAGVRDLLGEAQHVVDSSPVNVHKPSEIRRWITDVCDEMESLSLDESTRKQVLEPIAKWHIEKPESCSKCMSDGSSIAVSCERCNGEKQLFPGPHPAALRSQKILDVRAAEKEIELYEKLLKAPRFHPSFKVIGTLSSRMSGGDGLNPQGIKKTVSVRQNFPLAPPGYVLCGGDFDSFEVVLACAVFDDPALNDTLIQGKSIHALLGMELYGKTYDEIANSKGTSFDMYTRAKSGLFGFLYGGDFNTWIQKLSIEPQAAEKAYDKWCMKYPGIGKSRMRIYDSFCSMRQPEGIGSKVVWTDPADYVETFLGFRRYFTLENKICKALYELSNKPPLAWRQCPIKVVRRDREQTAGGALSSALYGAAFAIQAANMRAANNHLIQSPGAQITKRVQRRIWDIQPSGVHKFRVLPFNIHDEIMTPTLPEHVDEVSQIVAETVESFRERVPLVTMEWGYGLQSWAQKKPPKGQSVNITYDPDRLQELLAKRKTA